MRHRFVIPAALMTLLPLGSVPARGQFASGLYVSNVNASGVGEVDLVGAGNATPVTVVTNLGAPQGVGFSPDGQYLYVADQGTNTVNVYSNAGGSANLVTAVSLSTDSGGNPISSSDPAGLTVDSSGNVFVAMHNQATGTDAIVEIQDAATHPSVSVFLPQGIALASGIDAAGGQIYLGLTGGGFGSDKNGGKVFEVTSGGTVSQFPNSSTSFGRGNAGLASDGTYLYLGTTLANHGGAIEKVDLSTGAVTTIATGLPYAPYGLTLDSKGNLYFDDYNQIAPPGGGDVYQIAGVAGLTSAVTPTLYNNSFENAENAGYGPTYLSYNGPTNVPEPGSLAMSGFVALVGLAGFGWRRRRAHARGTEPGAATPRAEAERMA